MTLAESSGNFDDLRHQIEAFLADEPAHIDDDLMRHVSSLAEQAQATGDTEVYALAVWLEARIAGRLDDHTEAIGALRTCAETLGGLGQHHRAAQCWFEAGELVGRSGDRSLALTVFTSARTAARSVGDALLVARTDDRLAAAHWELGRLDLAEEHLRAALAVWEATDDDLGTAWARYRLGWCLASDIQRGERGDEAIELLGKVRRAAQQADNLRLVANCDEKAAWVLVERGDTDQAIALLRGAIAVFDALGDEYALLVARANLAEQLLARHQLSEAEYLLRTAIDTEGPETRHVRLGATSRLAATLSRHGRADEALRLLDDVLDDVDHDDRTEAPRYYLARAAVFHALHTRQATKEAAQRALDLLDRAVLPTLHAEALEYLARVEAAEGRHVEAEALFAQSMALYLLGDRQGEALRVAGEVVPDPPQRAAAVPQPSLATGLYL
jgi:tetratricopeptide (TPR) repeat protein